MKLLHHVSEQLVFQAIQKLCQSILAYRLVDWPRNLSVFVAFACPGQHRVLTRCQPQIPGLVKPFLQVFTKSSLSKLVWKCISRTVNKPRTADALKKRMICMRCTVCHCERSKLSNHKASVQRSLKTDRRVVFGKWLWGSRALTGSERSACSAVENSKRICGGLGWSEVERIGRHSIRATSSRRGSWSPALDSMTEWNPRLTEQEFPLTLGVLPAFTLCLKSVRSSCF